jgi:hypothetical protein
MPSRRRIIGWLGISALLAAVAGCALLERTGGGFGRADGDAGRETTVLRPVPKPRDAITVEIILVERPTDDLVMRESVWRELDQSGSLDHRVRRSLEQNGLRVGVASSSPPRSLQSLLGLTSPAQGYADEGPTPRVSRQAVVLASGGETQIVASPLYASCSVAVRGNEGVEVTDYANARFVFRLKAHHARRHRGAPLPDGAARGEREHPGNYPRPGRDHNEACNENCRQQTEILEGIDDLLNAKAHAQAQHARNNKCNDAYLCHRR